MQSHTLAIMVLNPFIVGPGWNTRFSKGFPKENLPFHPFSSFFLLKKGRKRQGQVRIPGRDTRKPFFFFEKVVDLLFVVWIRKTFFFKQKKRQRYKEGIPVPKKYIQKNIIFIKSCKNIDDVIHVIFSLFFITYLFSIIFILCSLFLFIFHLYKKYRDFLQSLSFYYI